MSTLVADCPRCGTQKISFDVSSANWTHTEFRSWVEHYEAFATCRQCDRSTIFQLVLSSYDVKETFKVAKPWMTAVHLNDCFKIGGFISIKDVVTHDPPEHIPEAISEIFKEGVTCFSVSCFNASATMFRLCVDLATKALLPEAGDNASAQPNSQQRRNLGLRLPWLFDQGLLDKALRPLAGVIKEDGNDGAHDGTIGKEEAEDLLDFTTLLLERLYTEPARISLAQARTIERRSKA